MRTQQNESFSSNPVAGNVQNKLGSTSVQTSSIVKIYNGNGRLLKETNMTNHHFEQFDWNAELADRDRGIYSIFSYSDHGIKSKRVKVG